MKLKKTTFATLSLLSVLSFGAFAVTAIDAEQAKDRESMGTISFDGIEASPGDMHEMISKQAGRFRLPHYRSSHG